MAVLHTTPLYGYNGLPSLDQLLGLAQGAADGVLSRQSVLLNAVAAIRRLPLTANDFRVPLDIVRHHVRSLQWRPLSLNDDRVQSQPDLCRTLRSCRWVMKEARMLRPMPLLADKNICYRL